MKTTALALSLVLGLSAFSVALAAAPANDSILKAVTLKGTYSQLTAQNLSLATAAATDPLLAGVSAGKTLWYALPTPPRLGYLKMDFKSTTAVASATAFTVQDPDNPTSTLTQYATTPFAAGASITMQTPVGPSQHTVIMVSGTGLFDLTWHLDYTQSLNDFPSDAYDLPGDRGTITSSNAAATVSIDEPVTTGQFNTVWYTWTPSFDGQAFVDTNFSFVDGPPYANLQDAIGAHATMLAVYTVNPLNGSLVSVTSDTDSGWSVNSRAGFTASGGTKYYISVGTVTGNIAGQFQLNYYQGNTAGEIYYLYPGNLGTVMENAGPATLTVLRRYAGDLTASCNLSTTGSGTATAGTDFTAFTNHVVSFSLPSAGDAAWLRTDSLAILNDSVAEPDETVALTLSSPSANATLGITPTGLLHIVDDDTPQSGIFAPVTQFRVSESSGPLQIGIQRFGPAARELELMQTPIAGNAVLGVDYGISSTLFAAADQYCTLQFYPQADSVFNGERTATIQVTGGITYTVVIVDDDPYLPMPGKLTAALSYANGMRQAVLYATISNVGTVSGKLLAVGQTLSFTGKLDSHGKLTVPIAAKGRPVFLLSLAAQDEQGNFNVQLQDSADLQVSTTTAMTQNFSTVANPCPFKSPYTYVTGSSSGPLDLSAVGTILVDGAGNAVLAGRLFDGTAFAATGYVDGLGSVSVAASLLKGQGCFGISGSLPAVAGGITNPSVIVNHPARSNDPAKMGPVVQSTGGSIARYVPPQTGLRMLDAWSTGTGSAVFSDGPVPTQFTRAFTISPANVTTFPVDAQKVKITLFPATGVFSGTFAPAGTTKILPIYGAVIQLPGLTGYGQGLFFDGISGGSVNLGPP